MKRLEVQVGNRSGLHARAAARFVQLANGFRSQITVGREGARVNGKSILGLLTLAAAQGAWLELGADGEDEDAALEGLAALVRSGFEEES